MTQLDDLKTAELDAFGLVQAAVTLDQARSSKNALASALEHNLQVWVAIKSMVQNEENPLPEAVKKNLHRLSDFVADLVLANGVDISDDKITTLININLQISEGLLEGPASN